MFKYIWLRLVEMGEDSCKYLLAVIIAGLIVGIASGVAEDNAVGLARVLIVGLVVGLITVSAVSLGNGLIVGLITGLMVVPAILVGRLIAVFPLPTLSAIFLIASLTTVSILVKRRKTRVIREHEEKILLKRRMVERQISDLVGDDRTAQGFLLALEKLTRFVPNEAQPILEAVLGDLEEYHVLESLIASTSNDVLRRDATNRRDAIRKATRALCAKMTQDALEVIREHQFAEAEGVLMEGEPRITMANRRFEEYLSGLREIREATGNENEEEVVSQFRELAETVVAKLPPGRSVSGA